jgi:hypothetical protein
MLNRVQHGSLTPYLPKTQRVNDQRGLPKQTPFVSVTGFAFAKNGRRGKCGWGQSFLHRSNVLSLLALTYIRNCSYNTSAVSSCSKTEIMRVATLLHQLIPSIASRLSRWRGGRVDEGNTTAMQEYRVQGGLFALHFTRDLSQAKPASGATHTRFSRDFQLMRSIASSRLSATRRPNPSLCHFERAE